MMKLLVIALVNIPMPVIHVLHVRRATPKIHRPKNAIHRVSARPMAEKLIVMVMVAADSREELLSVLVHLVSKMMDLSSALNARTQCLTTLSVKYDLSLLKIQLSPVTVYPTLSPLHSIKKHLTTVNKTPLKVKMVYLIGHRDSDL